MSSQYRDPRDSGKLGPGCPPCQEGEPRRSRDPCSPLRLGQQLSLSPPEQATRRVWLRHPGKPCPVRSGDHERCGSCAEMISSSAAGCRPVNGETPWAPHWKRRWNLQNVRESRVGLRRPVVTATTSSGAAGLRPTLLARARTEHEGVQGQDTHGCHAAGGEAIRKAVKIPVSSSNGYTYESAARAINEDRADLIWMGRA